MSEMQWLAKVCAIATFLIGATTHVAISAEIAGLNPSVRPADAPKITTFDKDQQWYVAALRGVSQPYPQSLGFLDDQGAWFTPFIHAGMTGRYDLRGLHSDNQ